MNRFSVFILLQTELCLWLAAPEIRFASSFVPAFHCFWTWVLKSTRSHLKNFTLILSFQLECRPIWGVISKKMVKHEEINVYAAAASCVKMVTEYTASFPHLLRLWTLWTLSWPISPVIWRSFLAFNEARQLVGPALFDLKRKKETVSNCKKKKKSCHLWPFHLFLIV